MTSRDQSAHPGRIRQRFSTHVTSTAPDGCWLWKGGLGSGGYGTFSLDGKTTSAHRAAYILFRGAIPEGMFVCHSCDVRRCVRPDHLFLGTAGDNMRDKVAKRRHADRTGERREKLTATAVQAIRKRRSAGMLLAEIAREFGVTPVTVHHICAGKTWRTAS